MHVGFNYPFSSNRFGSEIGPNIWVSPEVWTANNDREAKGHLADIDLPPLFAHVDRNLALLKTMGIGVVRWFLLGNGNSYGPAATRRKGVHWHNYEFNPPSVLDRRFRRDFTELLARVKKAGLQLIPSLISFEFGAEKDTGTGNAPGTGWGGKADVIREPAKRKVFLDTMLEELLAASQQFKEQIYAWEVINEPVWLCLRVGPLSRPHAAVPRVPEVSIDEMNAFLKDATARINRAGYRSTVGHRFFADLKRFETGTAPQFHYYNGFPSFLGADYSDPQQIRGQKLFARSPKPFLGEFDSRSDRFGDPWDDDLPNSDSTLERLQLLKQEGCELAIIWPELGGAKPGRVSDTVLEAEKKAIVAGDVIKLLPETCRSIAAFTGGTAPPRPSPLSD